MRNLLGIIGIAVGLVMATTAWAQSYPNRPVKLVIPYPPGGSTDLMGRLVARDMEKRMGQPIVVENRPGASGIIGMTSAALAEPDGYTMVFADQSLLAMHPHTHKKLGYDPLKEFEPVSLVARFPMTLVVHVDVPAKSLQEFIALAKSAAHPLTYASIGPGSPHQLTMERFKLVTGLDLTHVPYTGGGPATRAVASGEVQSMMTGLTSFASQLKSGTVRALAVASPSRLAAFPEIPTFAEAGMTDFTTDNWFGIIVPAKTDRSIIARLNDEIRQALATDEIKERFFGLGMEPYATTPDYFSVYLKQEYEAWGQLIRQINFRLD